MKRVLQWLFACGLLWTCGTLFSQEVTGAKVVKLKVEGVEREALVQFPAQDSATAPVIFFFHGHGGSAQNALKRYGLNKHWPEAIVVFMQGLKTPGRLTDPEGKKTGWQHSKGDQGDRDLKFFDGMLAHIKKVAAVDENRVYATGHSNGGGFTYLLWQNRADVFAAFAPSASAALKMETSLKPKPCIHFAGEKDPLVKFEWQQKTIEIVKKINGCEGAPREWAKQCKEYPSTRNAPLVTCIHPGGHEFITDAPELMVKFFKQHSRQSK